MPHIGGAGEIKGGKMMKVKLLYFKGCPNLSIFLFLLFFAISSISSAAIYYPAPAFELKEAVENGENISLDNILKDKNTKGVMLYFMTTW